MKIQISPLALESIVTLRCCAYIVQVSTLGVIPVYSYSVKFEDSNLPPCVSINIFVYLCLMLLFEDTECDKQTIFDKTTWSLYFERRLYSNSSPNEICTFNWHTHVCTWEMPEAFLLVMEINIALKHSSVNAIASNFQPFRNVHIYNFLVCKISDCSVKFCYISATWVRLSWTYSH